jgi:hypothetical protein
MASFPAQNTLTQFGNGAQTASLPPLPSASNPWIANPLFGRPIWTYTKVAQGPVRGPQPKLAIGSGRTAKGKSSPGTQSSLPGFVVEPDYKPTEFAYAPSLRNDFLERIPKTIHTGSNGRELVGTYQPHDFVPADRFLHQMRRATNWQVQEYPPNYRNLQAWQQVQKYRVQSYTLSARPLSQSNYFLGYQIDPQVAQNIGQTNLGYMGSM